MSLRYLISSDSPFCVASWFQLAPPTWFRVDCCTSWTIISGNYIFTWHGQSCIWITSQASCLSLGLRSNGGLLPSRRLVRACLSVGEAFIPSFQCLEPSLPIWWLTLNIIYGQWSCRCHPTVVLVLNPSTPRGHTRSTTSSISVYNPNSWSATPAMVSESRPRKRQQVRNDLLEPDPAVLASTSVTSGPCTCPSQTWTWTSQPSHPSGHCEPRKPGLECHRRRQIDQLQAGFSLSPIVETFGQPLRRTPDWELPCSLGVSYEHPTRPLPSRRWRSPGDD